MRDEQEQKQDMIAALVEARELLRTIALNRRKYGAIATSALGACHNITYALGEQPEQQKP